MHLFRYGFITFETQEDAQKILQEVRSFSVFNFCFGTSLKLTVYDNIIVECKPGICVCLYMQIHVCV